MGVDTTKKRPSKPIIRSLRNRDLFLPVLNEPQDDPYKTLLTARVMSRAWIKSLDIENQLSIAQVFLKTVITAYWHKVYKSTLGPIPALPQMYQPMDEEELDESVLAVAAVIGKAAAKLDVITAAYELGNFYTSIMPEGLRSTNGVFYTPPILTERLINIVSDAGVDWANATVADPACGGGAFLVPVAIQVLKAGRFANAEAALTHVESHIMGYEIDPFSAWLTQVFLEVALKDVTFRASRRLKKLVVVCNTLEHFTAAVNKFDLVIGNPPYGKLKLNDDIRIRYKDSLFGHPNLYGLFTHLAVDMVKPGGLIGYLTPTSFLSGEYFKNLRRFIRKYTIPTTVDFVAVRKGVFEDVLQETMLAVYKKKMTLADEKPFTIAVNEVVTSGDDKLKLYPIGNYKISDELIAPWILPRDISQTKVVKTMSFLASRLNEWGYKISTGQLVWNRHKEQLKTRYSKNCYPIVWAEAITQDGRFLLRAEKKNHKDWFLFQKGSDHLLTTKPCLLLQRTTAKEQSKRLINAILPMEVLSGHGAVIVENHLNMIIPTVDEPAVSLEVLSVFLNSKAVNDAFRTISGSVAVSAYELQSLPLPPPTMLKRLVKLVEKNASQSELENECLKLYTK